LSSEFTVGTVKVGSSNIGKESFDSAKNLAFTAGGDGYVKISGFETEGVLGFDFAGKVTDSVDLSGGRLVVDITKVLGELTAGVTDEENWANVGAFMTAWNLDNFDLGLLFGSKELTNWNAIDYLRIVYGEGIGFDIITDSAFASAGYGWAEDGAVITWSNPAAAAAPEPATMLMFGLGIAGIAVARRIRRK
jgi:hypothetical protein